MTVTINASTTSGLAISSDTSGAIAFQNDGTSNVTIDSSGNVALGSGTDSIRLRVAGPISTLFYPNVFNTRIVGTDSATSGNAGAGIAFGGFTTGTSVYNSLAFISGIKENTTDGNYSGALVFGSRINGSGGGNFERMRIDSSGNVLVTNVAGLGYGTGSGGTVTQGSGSGKATAVTLSKPTGQITMNNAALAAAAEVSFTVTNTVVAATDTVIVNHSSAGTAGSYGVFGNNIAAGSFAITVTNLSAGSLSEAIVVSFAVIKGASA